MGPEELELQEYEHATLTVTDHLSEQTQDYAEVRVWYKGGFAKAIYTTQYGEVSWAPES